MLFTLPSRHPCEGPVLVTTRQTHVRKIGVRRGQSQSPFQHCTGCLPCFSCVDELSGLRRFFAAVDSLLFRTVTSCSIFGGNVGSAGTLTTSDVMRRRVWIAIRRSMDALVFRKDSTQMTMLPSELAVLKQCSAALVASIESGAIALTLRAWAFCSVWTQTPSTTSQTCVARTNIVVPSCWMRWGSTSPHA